MTKSILRAFRENELTSTETPAPMTPAGTDLKDFPHTPLFRSRLFGSSFHAKATDSEWRAGVTLWLKSWDQVPAGSLPNDDIELCRLAELARDLKAWKKVRDGAMRGWALCSDGRLHHPVVAEGVNTAIEAKAKQRQKTAKARIAALEKHLAEAKTAGDKARITDEINRLQQSLSQTQQIGLSQSQLQRPREGEGKGEGKEKVNPLKASEANASGGEPPRVTDPNEIIFGHGVPLLTTAGTPEKQARSFLGGLRKAHGDSALIDKLHECLRTKPLQPLEWLAAALPPKGGGAGKSRHSSFDKIDYKAGVTPEGRF